MKASCKIVFFGNERLSSGFAPQGAPTLQALLAQGYNIVAVVANYEKATSRAARKLEIQEVAERHGIPVILPNKPSEIAQELKNMKADIGVLVAYGKIIPQSVIDIFPHGILNIHPSLLPKYRGPTPIEQAILDGTPQTGVSLMQLVKQMDAGPIYAQTTLPITGNETKQALTERLLRQGGELLIQNLPAILEGSLVPTPQNEGQATYSRLLTKDDGVLDPTKPAEQLVRQVRAFAGWPKSRLRLFGQNIIVKKARMAGATTEGSLTVPCGNNTYLEILELTAPSGRTMSGADFVRGYKK